MEMDPLDTETLRQNLNNQDEIVEGMIDRQPDDQAVCKQCGKELKMASIRRHIKSVHRDVLETLMAETNSNNIGIVPEENLGASASGTAQLNVNDQGWEENVVQVGMDINEMYGKSPNGRFQCFVVGCGKEFTASSSARRHVKNTHQEIDIPCVICNNVSKNPTAYAKHLKDAHKTTPAEMKKCKRVPISNDGQDFLLMYGNGSTKCFCDGNCGKVFSARSSAMRHVKKEHKNVQGTPQEEEDEQ